jgi:TetR/AcrR family transcriptional regulator
MATSTSPSEPPRRARKATRDPHRAQERILAAAMAEFAAKGFAGARVDGIARRARINKRMLYHYFGDKEDLFHAILQRKLTERAEWLAKAPPDPAGALPYWFELACGDTNWIRLLQWEALQADGGLLIDEKKRLANIAVSVEMMSRSQQEGLLAPDLDPRHALLTMISLITFPLAFPQITRLVTGLEATDPRFQKARKEFLRRFAEAFKPRPPAKQD